MTKLKDKGVMMKFLKIACLLFSMFFFSSLASAEETVISVSGPDILIDGVCYSATGGEAPYLWKTSEGSIDNSGCVSNIPPGKCGTAAITASDDCRVTGTKAVILHGGVGAISVSGVDAPTNGSCYVANNAVGAVQWGITKGAIDSNGCVSNIPSQCGGATVTATDSCGETAVKSVRMPSGKWARTSPSSCAGWILSSEINGDILIRSHIKDCYECWKIDCVKGILYSKENDGECTPYTSNPQYSFYDYTDFVSCTVYICSSHSVRNARYLCRETYQWVCP